MNGVYGTTSPAAATPSFPDVAKDGDVTLYDANGTAASLNSTYPTFVIIPGQGGYRADYGNLAAAISADTTRFPNGHVNVLIATWQGATNGPTIAGVNVPWMAALYVDTDGSELGDLLTALQVQGKIGLSTTTIVSEGLGDDIGNQAAKSTGGLGSALSLNPASALSGYLPSALTTYFQNSTAYETSSFLDTQLSLAASNQTLGTGDDNNPLLQHTFGIPWLTGQILAGNDSPLSISTTVGSTNLPAANDPPPPSFPAGLVAGSGQVEQVISHDPNSMIGPKGSGTSNMVPTNQPLPYTILFTNVPTAPAPAQQITINQQLDTPNLDGGTFRLSDFGFDGMTFSIPADSSYYQTTLDLTATLGFEVEFTATIDASTGIATWIFTTIDPSTGQVPQNPTIGLLPPQANDAPIGSIGADMGEGFVSYTIMAPTTDATGTVLSAQAAVTFDTQPPLDTPEIFNTVDSGAGLTSTVATLPTFENSLTFPVSWSGSDASNGSGIDDFTVYVSDNGGPYTAWLQDTTLTSAPFVGQDGHTYGFYSVATDNAGNVQAPPTTAQANTQVDVTPPATAGFSFPAVGGSYNTGHWTGTIAGSVSDSVSGVQQEQVSILDVATNKYWNGSAFASGTETFLTATLANPGANSTTWSVSFPSSNFPADGSYTVHAEGTDVAGNADAAGLLATFTYDNAPPTTTDGLAGTPGTTGFRSPVTVTLTAVDATGGVAATFYTIDTGSRQTYGGSPFTVSGQGAHNITFWSVDAAGNTETTKIDSFNIAAVSLSLSTFVAAPLIVPAGGQSIITLTAEDASGNAVAGASVAFGLAAGSMQSAGPVQGAVTDNGNGTYTATFTAGTQPGSDTLTATIYGQTVTSPAPTITVTPGPVSLSQSTISITPATLQAGGTATVVLTARDAFGNVEGGGLGIAFGLGTGAAGGMFSAVSDNGNGTYTATFTAATAGTARTITATIGGVAVTSALPTIAVTPGAASQLVVTRQPSSAVTAGVPFSTQPVVAEEDSFGNIITSDSTSTVTVTRGSQGTAALQGSNLTVMLSNGVATFSGLSYDKAETVNLAFSTSAGSFTQTSGVITVAPAAASHFTVSTSSTAVTGTTASVTVTALDSFNNIATGYLGTIHFTSTDGAATLPANYPFVSANAGVQSFNVTFKTPALTQTVTATDTSNNTNNGTSSGVTVQGLAVASFTTTATGFVATFDKGFSATPLHLYAQTTAALTNPSISVVLGASTNISGTLLVNSTTNTITFVKTGSALAAGTYTVTFVSSAAKGFVDAAGGLLAGDANGVVPGTNYSTIFTVTPATAAEPTLTIPDFARGPNSASTIKVPNNTGTGIPLTLTNASAVTSVTFNLTYDPTLLNITGVSGANLTLVSNTGGLASFSYSNGTAQNGTVVLGQILADVPNSAASNYKAKELLHLGAIVINGSNTNVRNADGVHVNAYLGDASGNGVVNGADVNIISFIPGGGYTGFNAFPLADPVILADVNADGLVNSTDLGQYNRFVANLSAPTIPLPPSGLTFTATGPDPTLSIPTKLPAQAGGTVTMPVNLDDPHPAGSSGMTEAILALTFDPTVLSVSAADIHLGSIPLSGTGWKLSSVVDATAGQIGIDLYSTIPIANATAGSLVTITFHVNEGATPGPTAIELVASNFANPDGRGVLRTEVDDNQGAFVLAPAPTNGPGGISGLVVVQRTAKSAAVGSLPAPTVGSSSANRVAVTPAESLALVASTVPASRLWR